MISGPNIFHFYNYQKRLSEYLKKNFIFYPTGFSKMYDFINNLTFLGGNFWDFLTNVWWVWHLGPLLNFQILKSATPYYP